MDKNREKLIERVRKVIAMTKSPNENEKLVALDRIQVMVAEHNLSEVELNMRAPSDMEVGTVGHVTRCEPWRRQVGTMVGQLYFCVYFYTDRPKANSKKGEMIDVHYMVGEKHNIAIGALMFDYVCDAIDQLASEATLKQKHKARKKYRESFIEACAIRVCQRIQDRIEAARKGEARDWHGNTLPVLASEYDRKLLEAREFLEHEFDMSQAETRRDVACITDWSGMHEGAAAGDKVGLDTQVRHDHQKRLQ